MAKAQFSQEGGVGEIVLTDPPLNLFDLELARDLAEATERARDSDARAILVRAEGGTSPPGRTWRYSSTVTRRRLGS